MSAERSRPGVGTETADDLAGSGIASKPIADGRQPDLMTHALAYARAGHEVFPVEPGGKRPICAHGKDEATTDAELIRDWWVQHPVANIGLRPPVGVLVVDVDPRAGGATALAELSRVHGGLSPTWTAYTGGGGLHAWYRVTGPLRAKLCTGVDLKHHSGYVVVPPSLHASGRRYTWGNALPIADAPDWLLPMLRRPAPVLRSVHASVFSGGNDDGLVRLVAAPGGDRHNRLFWAVRRAVERDGLTPDLRARLVVAAASLGDEEAQRTIDCAIAWPVAA